MNEPVESGEQARLEHGLRQMGLAVVDAQVAALLGHVALIRRWAGSYNLVSRGDLEALIERHVLDSLAVLPWIEGKRLLDVGSGAGFPGLPLAVVRPGMEVSLLDSSGKRARFLRQALRSLELVRVEVVETRVEAFEPNHAFNTIVSRAFSSLELFARRVRHLSRPGTRVLAIKGRHPSAELSGLPDWLTVEAIEPYRVPGLHAERHVVIMSLSSQAA
jgi:16S rRNA (guanine527-N7)-methyltransferase